MQREIKIYGVANAAIFTSQLVREGVTFKAECDGEWTTVYFTGGF